MVSAPRRPSSSRRRCRSSGPPASTPAARSLPPTHSAPLEDALQRFDADEVVISVTSAADDVVEAVRAIFAGPVTGIAAGPPATRP